MSTMAKSATVMYEKVPKTFHIKRSTLPRIRMFDQMSAVNMRLDNDRTVAVSMGLGQACLKGGQIDRDGNAIYTLKIHEMGSEIKIGAVRE